jgi:hypothetical protein
MNIRKAILAFSSFACANLLYGCFESNSPTAVPSSSSDLSETGISSSSEVPQASSSSVVPVELGVAPSISILPWNGAQGAYSIIMDDYCFGTTKSLQWADSIAFARQMSIGFAVVASKCQVADWAKATEMILHGSEPVNHSSKHTCADPSRCNGATPWLAGSTQLALEIDSSTQTIETNTGFRPTLFGYPYDVATDETQAELFALGYFATRSYTHRNHSYGGLNHAAYFDGFALDYDARAPLAQIANQSFGMDEFADSAVSTGTWALRETHGVADNSYGPWTQAEFIAHFDHLAALRDQGKLWVAAPSKVIRYINLSSQATWNLVTAPDAFEIQWSTPVDTLARYGVPLRIQVTGAWKAFQAGIDLGATATATGTLISVNPALGTLRLVP